MLQLLREHGWFIGPVNAGAAFDLLFSLAPVSLKNNMSPPMARHEPHASPPAASHGASPRHSACATPKCGAFLAHNGLKCIVRQILPPRYILAARQYMQGGGGAGVSRCSRFGSSGGAGMSGGCGRVAAPAGVDIGSSSGAKL